MTAQQTVPGLITPGFQLIDGTLINALLLAVFGTNAAAVALAGGGQAGATQLTAAINIVSTVGTAADSVALLPAKKGIVQIVVNNAGANSMQVFGQGADTINGVAAATGVAQAAGKSALYFCPADGTWFRLLSA